jgi:hypothetical protein
MHRLMSRTALLSCLPVLLLLPTACGSSANSSTGADSGSPPGLVFDSGSHDAGHDATITGLGGDSGLNTRDTGSTTPPADTGPSLDGGTHVPADGAAPTDAAPTDAAPTGDGAAKATDAAKAVDAGSVPTTCAEAHGSFGCCATSTAVYYCGGDAGTTLKTETCTGAKVCVYDTTGGYYHCGSADAGMSATHPAACGVEDAGRTADSGSAKDAGRTADSGEAKDAGRKTDSGGAKDAGGAGDAAVPTTCAEANGVIGCCSGETLYYCEGTTLISRACIDGNVCGWAPPPIYGYYDCGNLSGEAPDADPPKACR